MTTLKEIADICGVSATTVSNVLNGKSKASEETKQKILKVVQELDYRPNIIAQGLRSQKTHTITIIAEDIAQFTTPNIIESMMAYCEDKGYRTVVQNLRLYARWSDRWYDQNQAYRSILDPVLQEAVSNHSDGVIYIAGHARDIHCFPDDYKIPAVMAYAYSSSLKVPSVVIDDPSSSYELIHHLILSGHKKIGVVGGRINNLHTQHRLKGYQKALFEAGILLDPDLIYYGNWERESGYSGAKELLQKGITAIFCMCDRMAGGVYDCLNELGIKVGEDISVVSFDNQDIADYFTPGLTTTALPLSRIGHESARLLIDMLENKTCYGDDGTHKIVEIPCEMILRSSCSTVK